MTLTVVSPVAITTAELPNGTVGTAYSQNLAASGGAGAPYAWSVSAGALPPGLSISGATLGGTPTTAGNFSFTLRAGDAAGRTGTKDLAMAIVPALVVGTSSLPAATAGTAYSQPLAATGGTPPYTWSVASGTLPAGLAISGSTLAGTPTTPGAANVTLQVTDSAGAKATRAITINVLAPLTISTTALPGGTVGVPYSQTLAAAGGTPPYAWALGGGALPQGLQLGANGVLSGTPAAAGTASVVAKVTDAAGASATRTLPLAIVTPVTLSAPATITATAGAAFSQTLTAAGGSPPYTWSLASGSLPQGVQLGTGILSGTAAAPGVFDLTVQVADANGGSAKQPVRLVVNAAPTIVTTGLNSGIAGTAYSQALDASGGTAPLTWSVASGALPPGLSLSGAQIQGTPSAAGNFPVTLRVADANGAAATRDFAIAVGAGLTITTTSVPNPMVGAPYSQALAASGGAGPYTWAVASGSLPAGVTLSATGVLGGTPTAAGPATFTVQVTDSTGAKATQPLAVTVAPALSITTASLPSGATSAPYSQALAAAGGTPPYVWSVASGQLPPGVTLTPAGALGGTPTQNGDFPFTVKVTDSTGATATRPLTVHIGGGLAITSASPLPAATIGAPYAQALTAAGGVPPYRWALAAGSALPAGLALDPATGVIGGTPTAAGTSTFTVQVTDAAGATVSGTLTLTAGSDLSIQTASLPNGTPGVPYAQPLTAAGGKPPYKWSIANGGPLPPGLSLDPAGAIRGTPTQAGPVTFTAVVTDAAGAQATKQLTLTIGGGLAVTTASLPAGGVSTPYSQTLAASGGVPPYTWSVSAGALPAGLTLNPSTGALTGTPTAAGSFQFTAQVKDAAQVAATQAYTLSIGLAGLPGVSIGGTPDTGQPLAQSPLQITLASAFPADIGGQATLAFASDAAVPADDKAIAFANGQRTIGFRIPAGQTAAVFQDGGTQTLFQNGTVQGTVTITVTIQAAGSQ